MLPPEAGALMEHYPGWWAIAGGWALDLWLGEQTRVHSDLEIALLRHEQPLVVAHFSQWQMQYVAERQLHPWAGEMLTLPIHELHISHAVGARLELLLNEVEQGHWVFRRDPRVRLPFADLRATSCCGWPVLSPEVVLLYKARLDQPKDRQDLEAVWSRLSPGAQAWLRDSIVQAHPAHPWLLRIGA